MRKTRAREARPGKAGADEILPEYDFSRARPNKYASRYAKGSIVVPGAKEANEALRTLAGLIRRHQPRKAASRQSA